MAPTTAHRLGPLTAAGSSACTRLPSMTTLVGVSGLAAAEIVQLVGRGRATGT